MKQQEKKVLGEDRRNLILKWLTESSQPITGTLLASKTNVSRQVIVQDISILKARNYPILATSQGYVFIKEQAKTEMLSKVIACKHSPEETARELNMIVDLGGAVKDVVVEHPVYGDLTASLMIRNRRDVNDFIKKMSSTNASLLSQLTDGVHLHTIEARTEEQLTEICNTLNAAGFLLSSEDD
ncbi:transcription repressor NadR [Anaerobacillus arseniciselenatis]|uniref:Transcription repressor NadR n=1 Tax=Anaerobacillus arseniciselenatis TaxID=85682 RepID=A0A1S2LK52_9BACI|nr:transcription repressor NadR [Anaerobacillus arseniciselenatis]OIJ11855.1 transcription repressor NadR [Anaerobacillus arseniciselenatis]